MHGRHYNRTGINFNYTLDVESWVSYGVFLPDDTLIQTTAKRLRQPAGSYSVLWNGTDDAGAAVDPGTYTIKLLQHNIRYDWDGVIGNTASSFGGDVIRTFFPMETSGAIAMTSDTLYLVCGTNEVSETIRRMPLSDLGSPTTVATAQGVGWTLAATDGTLVYLADTGSADDSSNNTFIGAYKVSDDTKATFSSGTTITISSPHAETFSGFDSATSTPLSTYAATGLAVQLDAQGTGSLVAVAHGPADEVRLFNKTTGASAGTFSTGYASGPGQCAFDANGDLWVMQYGGTGADKWTTLTGTPTISESITGLAAPISIACHPTNASLVYIVDGGSSQQVKTFDTTGTLLHTQGDLGGYDSNGPTVTTTRYQWRGGRAPIGIDSTGQIYVADGDTNRLLVFNASWAYQKQLMWLPQTYFSSVDENDPTRVFGAFLEYQVDYSVPLQPGDPTAAGGNGCWRLVKNWAAGLTSRWTDYASSGKFSSGFAQVATLSNSRTYALAHDFDANPDTQAIVELTSSGIRDTGTSIAAYHESWYKDGSVLKESISGGTQTFQKKTLTGFDGSGNPQWTAYASLASWPTDQETPIISEGMSSSKGGYRSPQTDSGNYGIYNTTTASSPGSQGANLTGMHVGIFASGGTSFLAQGSPCVTQTFPFADDGSYQLGSLYAGSGLAGWGRILSAAYIGEFWELSEANQYLVFDQTGLALGQHGTTGTTSVPVGTSVPGSGGNAQNPIIAANGNYIYLFVTNEANNGGVCRWHYTGAESIREHSATQIYGFGTTLTAPTPAFPTGLSAVSSSQQVDLSWTGVSGATYKIKQSTTPGGPYSTVASGVAGTTYSVTGLTNDTVYYFAVIATVASVDSVDSPDVMSMPIDKTVAVHSAGKIEWGKLSYCRFPLYTDQPWPLILEASANVLGNLNQSWLGSYGYTIWGYPAAGNTLNHYPTAGSATLDANWSQVDSGHHLKALFAVDGVDGSQVAYVAGTEFQPETHPSNVDATIDVDPGDSRWYLLTFFSSSEGQQGRSFDVTVTPHGSASPAATQSCAQAVDHNCNAVFQFIVKGRSTLTIPAGALTGTAQAIFLDPAPGLN